jgi:hypothetical protein
MQLIGTGKQRAAKTSRVLIGAQALTFASWEVTLNGEDYDTTNFESYNAIAGQTYGEGILGPVECDLKFGGDWDAGPNPLGSPPGLYPRDDLQNVYFYTSRIDMVFWTFPYVRIRSSVNGGEVRGKVTFNTSGKSQGPFTFPTASIS